MNAEFLIKVGNSPRPDGAKDGDVVLARTGREIGWINAQHVCRRKVIGANGLRLYEGTDSDGLLPIDSLHYEYLLRTRHFMYVRTARNRGRFIRLSDQATVNNIRSNVTFIDPDGKERVIDWPLAAFLRRRLQRAAAGARRQFGPATFGTVGNERWFGGVTYNNLPRLVAVWNMIETKTGGVILRENNKLGPLGALEGRHFLAVRVEDIEPERVRALMRKRFNRSDEAHFLRMRRWSRIEGYADDAGVDLSTMTPAEIEALIFAREGADTRLPILTQEPQNRHTRFRDFRVRWREFISGDSITDVENRDLFVDRREASLFRDVDITEDKDGTGSGS